MGSAGDETTVKRLKDGMLLRGVFWEYHGFGMTLIEDNFGLECIGS